MNFEFMLPSNILLRIRHIESGVNIHDTKQRQTWLWFNGRERGAKEEGPSTTGRTNRTKPGW